MKTTTLCAAFACSILCAASASAFETYAQALAAAKEKTNQRQLGEAASNAVAAAALAGSPAERFTAQMLRAQIAGYAYKPADAAAACQALLEGPDALTDDQRAQALGRLGIARLDLAAADGAAAESKALLAMPPSNAVVQGLLGIAGRQANADPGKAEALLREALARPGLAAAQKGDLLQGILGIRLRRGSYEESRKAMEELRALGTNVALRTDPTLLAFATKAALFYDFKTAEAYCRQALAQAPDNLNAAFGAAEAALALGQSPAAAEALRKVMDNPKATPAQRYVARVVQLAAEADDPAAFRKRLPEADQAFRAEAFSPEQRFRLLREASVRLFNARRYGEVRELEAETAGMLEPEPGKAYACRYVKEAPASADAWLHSPLLKEPGLRESRFRNYVNLDDSIASELTRLKGGTNTAAADLKPGYETGVYAVYDARGVHLFVQATDPAAEKIEQGLAPGGSLELFLQPGRAHAYHQWFFDLPTEEETHFINWDAPGRHYRNTFDYLKKDAAVSGGSIGAYTFIPWLMVYDRLPSASNTWHFGLQRWAKGVGLTLGGAVHELGKGLELRFDMPPERVAEVRRSIVIRAWAKYQADRNRPDGIALWSDPFLGDPAFYTGSVKPHLEALDKAGEAAGESMTDADVERLFTSAVPGWMELAYDVADLRRDFVRDRLFESP